jgi:predicted transcriptional regulator
MAKKERFEFRVDEKFMEALTTLAERTHKNRADVIRDALNYYENALNEWEKECAAPSLEQKESPSTTSHRSPVPA